MIPIADSTPRRGPAWATWLLILCNLGVFGLELSLDHEGLAQLFYQFGIVPARHGDPAWAAEVGYRGPGILSYLTSMFLHAGWLHLIGNMWTLWIFGDNVEERMGRLRFLLFYLLCGLAAGVVHTLTSPLSQIPTVGASGAIAGVLGAYLLLFPRARILTVVPVLFYPLLFRLPAVLYLGFWFLTQFLSGTLALAEPNEAGGVAWWAHVGGFLAGLVLLGFFLRPRSARRRGR